MSYESILMHSYNTTDYAAALYLAATLNDNTKEIDMNGFNLWAARIKSSKHSYLYSNVTLAHKISQSDSFGTPFLYSGENWSGIDGLSNCYHSGTYGVFHEPYDNYPLLLNATIGTEIRDDFNTCAGHGVEIFTKIGPNCWAMTYGAFTSHNNQESDCVYDPIDGYTYAVDMLDMSYDDENDTYHFLEEKASRPRGSQKYRAR